MIWVPKELSRQKFDQGKKDGTKKEIKESRRYYPCFNDGDDELMERKEDAE